MMAWSTKHDEWIAEHCEGWRRITAGPCAGMWKRPDRVENIGVPNYITNPAAAIRAAEAWRKKEAGRSYHTDSALDDAFGSRPESACCRRNYHSILGSGEGPGCLAQALYRATGGPA